MKILYTEKNGDTGEMQAHIVMSNSEIKWLKSAAYKYEGDLDDAKEIQLKQDVRGGLLDCKNILNPA